MAEIKNPDERLPGMIEKAANLAAHDATEEDLKLINKHALTTLKAEEVFVFRAVLCDNEIDRQYERFNLKALQELQKLFVGKTVIKDHFRSADNQVARIYATELEQGTKTTTSGELYTKLIAKCYMVKTAGNADLIAEIKGGIKKEGSVGFSVSSAICSICGVDNAKSYCSHWRGRSYDKEGGKQVCTFTLAGIKDAYEFSLVAVPAQKAAGACKSYTGEEVYEKEETPEVEAEPTEETENADKAKEMALRARISEARARTVKN